MMYSIALNHSVKYPYPIVTYEDLTLAAGDIDGVTLNADTIESVGSNLVTDSGFDAVTEGASSITGDDSDFSGGIGNWTSNIGGQPTSPDSDISLVISVSSDYIRLANGYQTIVKGLCYKFSINIKTLVGDALYLRNGWGNVIHGWSSTGEKTFYFNGVATGETLYLSLSGVATNSFTADNITLQPITFTNWTAGTGWAPQATAGALTGKAQHIAGTLGDLTNTGVAVSGNIYRTQYVLETVTAGYTVPRIGNVNGGSGDSVANTYSYDITSGGTSIVIRASSGFAGTIDNVTVQQVTNPKQNGITVELHRDSERLVTYKTVAGVSTVLDDSSVDPYGAEELTNGDFATGDTTGWTVAAGATINEVVDHDGQTKAFHFQDNNDDDTGAYQDVLTVGKTYRVSFKVKVISGSVYFGQRTNLVGGKAYTDAVWTEYTADYVPTNTLFRAYSGIANSEWYIDDVSIKEVPEKTLIAIHDSAKLLSVFYNSLLVYSGAVSDASIVNNKRHYVATGEGSGSFSVERWTLDDVPLAYRFDGAGDYISLGDESELDLGTAPFTILVSAKIPASSDDMTLVGKRDAIGNYYEFRVDDVTGTPRFFWNDGTADNVLASTVVDDNTKRVIVITRDGTSFVFYKNGSEDNSDTGTMGDASDNAAYIIGAMNSGVSNNYTGSIDRVLQFNLALSSTEVATISAGGDVPAKYVGASQTEIATGSLTVGLAYRITAQDGEDFTADGAADNSVGTEFVATGTSVSLDANDKVVRIGCVLQLEPEDITSETWSDTSGNSLDGTVDGAVVIYNGD